MRIVSFLPSATEMLYALDLADDLVGVTFECDYPADATRKPQVVHSHLPPGLLPSQIDEIVRAEGAQGRSLYFADLELLKALAPDFVVLQDLCRVCAVDTPTIERDLSQLPSRPQLHSLSAHTLSGVLEEMQELGRALGCAGRASALVATLRARIDAVEALPGLAKPPRVLALEWLDPFFQGGHWIPEMITLSGGQAVLATPGEKSIRLTWEQVQAADPDMVIVMPCGYHLPETVAQYREVRLPDGWSQLRAVEAGQVFAVDGSAFFSRPGPRLVDGLELLAKLFRGEPAEYIRL